MCETFTSAIRSVQDVLFAVSQQQHRGWPEHAQQLSCRAGTQVIPNILSAMITRAVDIIEIHFIFSRKTARTFLDYI